MHAFIIKEYESPYYIHSIENESKSSNGNVGSVKRECGVVKTASLIRILILRNRNKEKCGEKNACKKVYNSSNLRK